MSSQFLISSHVLTKLKVDFSVIYIKKNPKKKTANFGTERMFDNQTYIGVLILNVIRKVARVNCYETTKA